MTKSFNLRRVKMLRDIWVRILCQNVSVRNGVCVRRMGIGVWKLAVNKLEGVGR